MADGGTYKIVVTLDGGGSSPGDAPTTEETKPDKKEKKEKTKYEKFQAKAGKFMAGVAAVSSAAQYMSNFKMQEINIVTGQTQLAQKIDAQRQIASSITSLANSALSGGVLASVLGISGPAGIALGIVSFAGQKVMDYAQRNHQLALKKYVEDEQLQVLRSRAGASFNRSRLGS